MEKVLLRQESFRRTLLLLIEGVFAEEEPDLSAKILAMYHRCPLVFQNYLQLAEHIPDETDDLDDLDETEALEMVSMDSHRDIRPRSLLTEKDILKNFQIPLRLSKLDIMHPFAKQLRCAYKDDYHRPNILNLGTDPARWCQKITFSIGYCFPP